MAQMYQAIGLGFDRFLEEVGKGLVWGLDRLMDEAYFSEGPVGHDEPQPSGPLTFEVVERMPGVEVSILKIDERAFQVSCDPK